MEDIRMKGNSLVKRIASAILAFALVLTTVVVGNVTTATAKPNNGNGNGNGNYTPMWVQPLN